MLRRTVYGVAGLKAGRSQMIVGTNPPASPPPNHNAVGRDVQARLQRLEKSLDDDLKQIRVDIQEVQDYVRGDAGSRWKDIWPKIIEAGATVAATVLVTLLVRHWWASKRTGISDEEAAQEALSGTPPPII